MRIMQNFHRQMSMRKVRIVCFIILLVFFNLFMLIFTIYLSGVDILKKRNKYVKSFVDKTKSVK